MESHQQIPPPSLLPTPSSELRPGKRALYWEVGDPGGRLVAPDFPGLFWTYLLVLLGERYGDGGAVVRIKSSALLA